MVFPYKVRRLGDGMPSIAWRIIAMADEVCYASKIPVVVDPVGRCPTTVNRGGGLS